MLTVPCKEYETAPGYPTVTVDLGSINQAEPEVSMICTVADGLAWARSQTDIVIDSHWRGVQTLQLLQGRMSVTERRTNQQKLYSFGGTLTLTARDQHLLATIVSDAPVLVLQNDDLTTISSLLAFEAEMLSLKLQRQALRMAKLSTNQRNKPCQHRAQSAADNYACTLQYARDRRVSEPTSHAMRQFQVFLDNELRRQQQIACKGCYPR